MISIPIVRKVPNMTKRCHNLRCLAMIAAALLLCSPAGAAEIGQIKISKGQVTVERKGAALPATVGMRLESADVLRTGADGSVGITMADNSLLSAGPNSILSLDRFEFDPTTSQGQFDAQLRKGSLARDLGAHREAVAGGDDGAHADRQSSACAERNSCCPRMTRHLVRALLVAGCFVDGRELRDPSRARSCSCPTRTARTRR
jgi:hypothetical protein